MVSKDEDPDIDIDNSITPSHNQFFKAHYNNNEDICINTILSRCLDKDFHIEQSGSAVAEDNTIDGQVMFRTGSIRDSWIRGFRSGIAINFANEINFRFKGNILQDTSILARIGVGMEGPNADTDLSAKFGLEASNDGASSFYSFVTSDGISRQTLPTSLPMKETNAKCYALTLEPGVSCKLVSWNFIYYLSLFSIDVVKLV